MFWLPKKTTVSVVKSALSPKCFDVNDMYEKNITTKRAIVKCNLALSTFFKPIAHHIWMI